MEKYMRRFALCVFILVFSAFIISVACAAKVPSGVYTIGEDIPAGVYTISCTGKESILLHLWGRAIGDYSSNGGSIYQVWVTPGEDGKIGKIVLEEGNVLEINGGALIVEKYQGFSFENDNASEFAAISTNQKERNDISEIEKEDAQMGDFSNDTRISGLYTYSIKGNGTVSIIDYDWSNSSGDIYIPSMLDGYTVTTIGEEAFADGKKVSNNNSLVVIPDSITIIGDKAFYNSPVSAVKIPVTVQSIGKGAFAYCNITQFIVDQNQPYFTTVDGVLYDKRNKALLAHPQKKSISSKIPEGIVSISDYAFSGMTIGAKGTAEALCLTDILPSSLTSIEPYAFENCTLYYSANNTESETKNNYSTMNSLSLLPVGVVSIGDYSFKNCVFKCNSLFAPETVVIGDNLQEIGDYAFYGCKFYDGFTYNLILSKCSLTKIGRYAFASSVITSFGKEKMKVKINLPDEIKEIGENAFFQTHPVFIQEETAISTLGAAAFQNTIVFSETKTDKFQKGEPVSLSVPGTLKTIPSSAFAYELDDNLNTIERIEIHEGVKTIEESAFIGYQSIQTVSFPNTLTEIGRNAFSSCQRLLEAKLPESVVKIGDNAFERQLITLIVKENSYAALWASENGYNYRYEGNEESLDWLNSDIH